MPDGTPPTPPSQSPSPASPLSRRVPAVAQLRPVSIPDIVRDMAGTNAEKKQADFDRRYMPDGVPEPDLSVTGITGEHRSNLKRKAKGIARSLAEVLAYLTLNTSSLNESKKQLSIHHQCKLDDIRYLIICILLLICILYTLSLIMFLRSWIFNQPILNIRHFAQCQNMCDAQSCRKITRFSKNHLQKVQNICYFLVNVPLVTVACSL